MIAYPPKQKCLGTPTCEKQSCCVRSRSKQEPEVLVHPPRTARLLLRHLHGRGHCRTQIKNKTKQKTSTYLNGLNHWIGYIKACPLETFRGVTELYKGITMLVKKWSQFAKVSNNKRRLKIEVPMNCVFLLHDVRLPVSDVYKSFGRKAVYHFAETHIF